MKTIILYFLFVSMIGCASIPGYTTTQSRKEYVDSHPDISKDIKEAILNKIVIVGMTKQEAIASWGHPGQINTSMRSSVLNEQWVYPSDNFLYFTNDKLESMQTSQ